VDENDVSGGTVRFRGLEWKIQKALKMINNISICKVVLGLEVSCRGTASRIRKGSCEDGEDVNRREPSGSAKQ